VTNARGAASPPAAEAPWERIARFEFNALAADLSRRGATDSRSNRLALAVALLNRQPRTVTVVEEAAASLAALAKEKADDDAGLWARYLEARIAQLHRAPADPAEAARRFGSLAEQYSEHPAGVRAAVKLAVLLVHEPAVEPSRDEGFKRARTLIAALSDRSAQAEGFLMLARAGVFFRRGKQDILADFNAALRAGIANPPLRASALYTAGDLARELGRRDEALAHFKAFVAENRRDQRTNLVREWIAELEGVAAR
jgi:thioredoxin-like negative regulator of GroEL